MASMPEKLVFVRHGQSEANILQAKLEETHSTESPVDYSAYTDSSWRLSPEGEKQAAAAGEFINKNYLNIRKCVNSPFTRTRETAALLNLADYTGATALWHENRLVRERSWGEINFLPPELFRKHYPNSATLKEIDPLYWAPPGGESIIEVAENRVHNYLKSLRGTEGTVVTVTHGDFMLATRLVLEEWDDEQFARFDKAFKIPNAAVLEYTRENIPGNSLYGVAERFQWVRMSYPELVEDTGAYEMRLGPWERMGGGSLTGEELLAKATVESRRLGD